MDEPAGLLFAKEIVALGWKVVPGFVSKAGEKVPIAGGNWQNKATLEDSQLETWWAQREWLWPGTLSGVGSSLIVDCDGPLAVDWLREKASAVGWSHGSGLIYRTPGKGGGLHCVWDWPEWLGRDFRQAKVKLDDGAEIQIRGNGHWTLLFGAPRRDGHYTLVAEPNQCKGCNPAPEVLIRAILAESVVSTGTRSGNGVSGGDGLSELSPEEAWDLAPLSDNRKNSLAGLAWHQAIRGNDLDSVLDICIRFNLECCTPVLSDETVLKKCEYAVNRAEAFKRRQQEKAERGLRYLMMDGNSA